MSLPSLVIDLAPVASNIYRQLAHIWLELALAGAVLAVLMFMVLNRKTAGSAQNQGDVQARQVSLVWMVFLLLMVTGFAVPVLRFVLVAV